MGCETVLARSPGHIRFGPVVRVCNRVLTRGTGDLVGRRGGIRAPVPRGPGVKSGLEAVGALVRRRPGRASAAWALSQAATPGHAPSGLLAPDPATVRAPVLRVKTRLQTRIPGPKRI